MSTATVLVIDDDAALRKLMLYTVGKAGFKTLEAETVKEALLVLASNEIHVVLSDVNLPDGNGVELTKVIKAAYPAIEVIAITAEGRIADGVKAMKNGAFDYLQKGEDDDRLISLLTHAADKALLQNRINQLEQQLNSQEPAGGRNDVVSKNASQIDKATLIIKAIQSPLRQGILHLIFTKGRATVTEIYTELNLPQAIASQHLLILKNAGLVNVEREGTKNFYSANYTGIDKILTLVQQLMPGK